MVLRETLVLTMLGFLAGLPYGMAASKVIAGMFYGVSAYDPITLLVVSLLLAGIGVIAGVIPAWRAMRLDPMVALRCE